MLALVFLAQIAATSPTPTPTPPMAIAAVSRTVSDVARDRRSGQKGVPGGTFSVAGAPVPPDPGPARVAAASNGERTPNGGTAPAATPVTAADAAEARALAARRNWRAAMNDFWDEAEKKGTTSEALEPLRKKLERAERAMLAADADAAKHGR